MGIIKSFAVIISLGIAALGLTAASAKATQISNADLGLTSPGTLIDFGVNAFALSTPITNQFIGSGVTFAGNFNYQNTGTNVPSLAGGHLNGVTSSSSPNSILFSANVTDALFSFRTNTGTTTFSAFLDELLITNGSFSAGTNADLPAASGKFYGFTGLLFNKITFDVSSNNDAFNLDNLQFNNAVAVIPLPAALPLFLTGLAGLGLMRRRRRQGYLRVVVGPSLLQPSLWNP